MFFTQIKETCLYSRDLDRAYHFYGEILELPLISRVEGRHVFFRAGTSVLLIFNPDATQHENRLPPHSGQGPVHLAFETTTEQYDAVCQALKDKGVEIIHQESWPGLYRSFYFHDPDGHVLEVVEAGMWEYKEEK